MTYAAVDAEAIAPENAGGAVGDMGIAMRVSDDVILAFFSLAYESAVILLRIRSRLIPSQRRDQRA